jgi:glycosyltransferase 2 family protein
MRQLRILVQAAISLLALAAVVWWALHQEAPSIPRSREAAVALGFALALYVLATLVRAERWQRILTRAGLAVRRRDSYRLTAVGYMGNNVLPARSGDVLRAFLLAPLAGTRKRHVLGTVVAERLLDAAALTLVFALVVYGLLRDVDVPGGRIVLAAALAVAALAAALVAAALVVRRRDALRTLRDAVRPLSTPTRSLASAHGGALLLLSVGLWALEASVYLEVGHAVGLELGLLDALYVVALTNLFALVPAAPGYVGTFDAAVLFALDSLGASGSQALSYLVVVRFVLFVPITVVGLVFLLTRYGGWPRLRAARLDPR